MPAPVRVGVVVAHRKSSSRGLELTTVRMEASVVASYGNGGVQMKGQSGCRSAGRLVSTE